MSVNDKVGCKGRCNRSNDLFHVGNGPFLFFFKFDVIAFEPPGSGSEM